MQYVNINLANTTDVNMNCSYQYSFDSLVQGPASDYNLKIARADYCLNNMPIYYLDKQVDFYIKDATSSYSKICFLPAGFYTTIKQFTKVINNQINTEVGDFNYNTNTGKLEFRVINGSITKYLLFPAYLKKLFDGFDYDFEPNNFYSLHEKSTTYVSQEYSTVDRFSNMKSIKVFANIGQQPHIEISNLAQATDSYLLSDQVISASDSLNRLIYIPTQYRNINLTSHSNLKSFTIYVEIEYANLKTFPLTLAPGNYFNTLLIFEKKNQN